MTYLCRQTKSRTSSPQAPFNNTKLQNNVTRTTSWCSVDSQHSNPGKNVAQLKELAESHSQTCAKDFVYPWFLQFGNVSNTNHHIQLYHVASYVGAHILFLFAHFSSSLLTSKSCSKKSICFSACYRLITSSA